MGNDIGQLHEWPVSAVTTKEGNTLKVIGSKYVLKDISYSEVLH